MPKRSNKAIKAYRTKSGTKYMFKTYIGTTEDGKPVQITRQGFSSYAEANAVFEKVRAKGIDGYVKQNQIKLDKLWQLWFDTYRSQVKESTANKTYQVYQNHIFHSYGNVFVDKINSASLQKWINALSKELVKYKDPYNIMNNLLKYAVILGYIHINPLTKIIVPKKTARKRRDTKNNYYDSVEQVNEFLDAAKKQNFRKYTFFKLLVTTGLRKGEALALEWSDIDWDKHLIHVTKTLTQGMGSKQIIQSPKTKKSLRDVPLSESLAKTLHEYKKQNIIDSRLVFHKGNGDYLNLSAPTNWLSYLYKNNSQLKRITVHGFRHTFATLMLQPGTGNTPKDIQTILGHETIDMTLNIYTHITKKGKSNVLSSVNSLDI